MPIVADASVAIRGDMSGFHRDLKGAEVATSGLGGRLRQIFSPKNLLTGAGLLGIGLGIQQITRQVGDLISEYSELKQAQRTVDDVFGASASVIEDWADRAADAAGLSRREVSLSASTMGTMLINMGIDAGTAADMVVDLQQRAADLATAFPGKSTEDAMLAFSAALRGERDTVEKFGVTLTQAMIDARIETMNLDTSTPAAERYATAIATLGIIMEQTAPSVGRFADALEENDPQAMARSLGARIENANAALAGNVEMLIRDFSKPFGDLGIFFDNIFGADKQAKVQEMADALGIAGSEMWYRIQTDAMEAGRTWEAQLDHMVAITNENSQELGNAAERTGVNIAQQFEKSVPVIQTAADMALKDPLIVAMLGGQAEAERIASETPGSIADALLDAQFEVEDAASQLQQTMEDALHPMIERASIIAFLTSQELADGLADGRPAVRQRALELKEAAEARLRELAGAAFGYGNNVGTSFADGMNAAYGYVRDAAGNLAAAARGQIGINSEPADPSSPLRGITKWGGNIVDTIAAGIYGNLGTGSAAAGALAGALVPSLGGGAGGMAGGMGTGTTIQYILQVEGKEVTVGSRDDVLDRWDQLFGFGDRSLTR